ncbi:MAG TPA: NUDIX hydrolase [Acidobacteriota bacterium]|jgi:ADP-ribose pyrophosphatase
MKIIEHRKVYSGKILDLEIERVQAGDGREKTREIVRHPGGVAVLAEIEGRILFVRQLRYPLDSEVLELPAGKLDEQEDPMEAARRELEEETGFRPSALRKIGEFLPSPGYSDEVLHIFVAVSVESSIQSLEWDEEIRVEYYSLSEAIRMISRGEIRDAKTVIGLLWLANERSGQIVE